MSKPRALILLATLNGSKYLSSQIESILSQSMTDWLLLVSDDGSHDDTVPILERYSELDSRIVLLPTRQGSPGHVSNFEYLLRVSREYCAEGIFLCDQDDIWYPTKLELLLEVLEPESCAFTDLDVFRSEEHQGQSYMKLMGLGPPSDIYQLIAQNSVVGCSLAIEPGLLDIALPFPVHLQNHDWWLAMCAMSCGGLRFVDRRLTRYRQHGSNAIGARDWFRYSKNLPRILERQRKVVSSKPLALRTLLGRLQGKTAKVAPALEEYLDLFEQTGRWERIRSLCRGPFRPRSASLTAIQSAAILLS